MMLLQKRLFSLLLIGLLALSLAITACGPSAAEQLNKEGNDAFTQQAFQDALIAYQRAQIEEPELAEPYYNAANALYRQGAYDAALEQMQKALSFADQESLAQAGFYNQGNAAYNQQDLETAVASYTQSLLINPDDQDAKYNLELTLRRQEDLGGSQTGTGGDDPGGDDPGGDDPGSGVIELVVDLTGHVIPESGYFVAAEDTFTLGTHSLNVSLNFENSDNVNHLLVRGFSGAVGDDLDTNDNGVLDITPWSELLDLIAIIEEENPPINTEFHYGTPTVGPDGSFVPGHIYRCENVEEWQIGSFDLAGRSDSPGAHNDCSTLPPQIAINEVDVDQESSGTDRAEFIELYDGGVGNTALDDMVVVLFDSIDHASYGTVDLNGQTTNGDGYFVICGNASNVENCDLDISPDFDLLDDGPAAIALLARNASEFPNGTPVNLATDGLQDAIVYGTADPADEDLMKSFTPRRQQIDEGGKGDSESHSIQLCINHSSFTPITDLFVQSIPSPKAGNDCPKPMSISEIRIDQSGADNDEFFELSGTPGTSLEGLTYLVIGDATGDSNKSEENQEEQQRESEGLQEDQFEQSGGEEEQPAETQEGQESDEGQEGQEEQQDPGQQGEQEQEEQQQQGQGQPQEGQPDGEQQGQLNQLPAPGQRMTEEQAKQLLAAIARDGQTLQEKLGQIFAVPWVPPVQDW